MLFDYFRNVSSKGSPMLSELITSATPEMVDMLNKIRDGQTDLKRRLPAVTWQASFTGGRRKNVNAVPSGLVMVDIDHIDNPARVWEMQVAPHREELHIVAVHKTPSCRGLRIVAECDPKFDNLSDNQKWIGEVCGLDIDACTKDWARLSFLVPLDYFFYLDDGIFTREPICKFVNNDFEPETNENNESNSQISNSASCGTGGKCVPQSMDVDNAQDNVGCDSQVNGSRKQQSSLDDGNGNCLSDGRTSDSSRSRNDGTRKYKGIPYADIISCWMSQNGGEPVEGERNIRLFRLALSLRYICDFDIEKVFSIIPRYGLSDEEVRNLVKSANNAKRGGRIPRDMMAVLIELGAEKTPKQEDGGATLNGWGNDIVNVNNVSEDFLADLIEDAEQQENDVLPVLPPLVRDFVNIAPPQFKQAMLVSMLPVLGTLLTRLRAEYLDGVIHAPNFQVVVEAPQASGKSFTRKMVDFLMRPIVERDNLERVKEQQYLAQLKLMKNAKKLPEEPEIFIRVVPATISTAKLLKRLDKSRGVHLFTFLEELDTLTKSNQAGAWSQKSDIYRNAFDNSEYGQDYMSDNSYSAIVKVFYNMLLCGTPRAVGRFYKDPEDGLCSRVVFCKLPDQFGEKLPVWKSMTENVKNQLNDKLDEIISLTFDKNGALLPEQQVAMKWLHPLVEEWLEEKRILAIENQDRALDIFRRRSAVIAFRASMLIFHCWTMGMKNKKGLNFAKERTKIFFRWLAEFVLTNQHEKYSKPLNEEQVSVNTFCYKTKRTNLFESLSDEFTLSELAEKCKDFEVYSSVKDVIYKWKKNGFIERIDRRTYKKIKQ